MKTLWRAARDQTILIGMITSQALILFRPEAEPRAFLWRCPHASHFIIGARGAGKTTLIRRRSQICPAGAGFYTANLPTEPSGTHNTYLHPAWQPLEERTYTPDNQVGRWNGQAMRPFPEVFDTLGVSCLAQYTSAVFGGHG